MLEIVFRIIIQSFELKDLKISHLKDMKYRLW